jgi:hypothetical protein
MTPAQIEAVKKKKLELVRDYFDEMGRDMCSKVQDLKWSMKDLLWLEATLRRIKTNNITPKGRTN